MAYPASIKGVLFVHGKVLLVRNGRAEWELPGGRLEIGEMPEQALVREFAEELSVQVDPAGIIDSYLFEVIPSKHVFIVTYGCRLQGQFNPALSAEHEAFGLHALDALDRMALPAGYKRSIQSWSKHAGS